MNSDIKIEALNHLNALHQADRIDNGDYSTIYDGLTEIETLRDRDEALEELCIECESRTCQFNRGGECRFAMVHERKPRITDDDGCIDYDYQEGEC